LFSEFEISNFNMKLKLKTQKTHVSLSVHYDNLNRHISEMLSLQCHLLWIDVIMVNKENYFNMIWTFNEEVNGCSNKFQAKLTPHMIFYDLNTAQMSRIYKEFSVEQNWNLELIDSYVKVGKSTSADKSNEDIYYICQFRNISDYVNLKIKNKEKILNQLQHSIIDNRFNECFTSKVKFSYGQNYIPIKLTPLILNLNTAKNKHYYYTIIYKPISRPENQSSIENSNFEDLLFTSSNYYARHGMTDNELLEVYNLYTSKGWKLVDLKAYKDEKDVTKFSTILTCVNEFYEGSFKLFIGLNKNELVEKIEEMNLKGLYPKILTNYGYLNKNQEHVYAIFFCQYI
jgi:hypothetical protein